MSKVRVAWVLVGAWFLAAPALAVDYQATAQRAIPLLDPSEDGRTICLLKKVQEDGTDDRYVADFYNIKQTAGGLPADVSFESFLNGVSYRLRDQLGKDSLYGDVSDEEIAANARTYDSVIRQIFNYLNANVHQAAAGEAHKELWNYILDQTQVSSSLYSCYSGTFVDNR